MHTDNATPQDYVLPNEVQDRFRISRKTLYSLVSKGHLHPIRLTVRCFRYPRKEVDALADKLEWEASSNA